MADFEKILQAAGDFGLFQKLLLFALSFPNLLIPFHVTSLIFHQASMSSSFHHCNTNWILTVGPNLTKKEQLSLTVPQLLDGSFSMCEMFAPVNWSLENIRQFGLNETTSCMHGYIHDTSYYEFDLVCDQAFLVGVAQTTFLTGILVGSLLFGPFSESYICLLLLSPYYIYFRIVFMIIAMYVTGLSPNVYVYMASQFIIGVSFGGFRINSVILATEWIGMTKRAYAVCLGQVTAALGQCVLIGVVYFIRDWRTAQFIMGAPSFFTVIYIWFLPESARWLLEQGRTEESKKAVLKAAAFNKRTVPDALLVKLSKEKVIETGGIKSLLSSSVLRKYFLTLIYAWAALNLAYTSLSLNVGKFGMGIFTTQLIFGLTEIPAHILCVWLSELAGRKPSLMSTLLLGGTTCLVSVFIPHAPAVVALVTTGRFFMNWAGSICYVYTQELFPTSVRQTATGLAYIVAKMGGMLSPLLNLLGVFHEIIPTVVLSIFSISAGALAFLLPETKRTELPDSMEEAERKRYKHSATILNCGPMEQLFG
uniref:Major facilitator superfamily (MFS) profile domain-containing protein n=1 Tax=Denticeps clupeoides TaxID=299321 RepID=A0AAY4A4Q5_9TELE